MLTEKPTRKIRPDVLIALALSLATAALYWNVQHFGFVIYDDHAYVVANPMVQKGLTREGVVWAVTAVDPNAPMWHPLTWISLMLDREFYGADAGGYHWTNLFFHLANTLLLFFALLRMTDSRWRSAFVAFLFAVHPLHVESVAWVSSRKDVLFLFFWLVATWAYARYVERLDRQWYLLTLIAFALSLTAKPMAVTFPFVLLLLDYWPLDRFWPHEYRTPWLTPCRTASPAPRRQSAAALIREKAPFFALSLVTAVIAYLAQERGEAIQSLNDVPLALRASNAVVACLTYLTKALWPLELAAYYPLPRAWPLWHSAFALALVAGITVLVLSRSKTRPYLFTGWFWFLGTLVPVIGLVQVGSQALADRYTYLPLTGLFLIAAWGAADIADRHHALRGYLAPLATAVIGLFMLLAWFQIQHWRDSVALFRHTLAVTGQSAMAHNGMGVALRMHGDPAGAEFHFREAIRIRPRYAEAHANLGVVYNEQRKFDDAARHLREALRLHPRYQDARMSLGHALLGQERFADAIAEYSAVLRERAAHAEARNYLGVARICMNDVEGAIREFETALRIEPRYAKARVNLANALDIRKALALNAAPIPVKASGSPGITPAGPHRKTVPH